MLIEKKVTPCQLAKSCLTIVAKLFIIDVCGGPGYAYCNEAVNATLTKEFMVISIQKKSMRNR